MSGWTLRGLFGEGARNAAFGGGRSILSGFLLLVVVLLVSLEDGLAMSRSVELGRDRQRAGENVFVIEPSGEGDQAIISVPECAALSTHPQVVSSGALLSTAFVQVPNQRSQLYRKLEVTAGAVEVIIGRKGGLSDKDVLISEVLARQLGVNVGSVLGSQKAGGEPVFEEIRAVLALDDRLPELGRAALSVGPPVGRTSQCLVEVREDYRPAARDGELLAAFSAAPRSITARSVLQSGTTQESPLEKYASRASRLLWAPAALVVGTMWMAALAARRPELGLYSSYQVRRSQGVFLLTVEFTLTALPALGSALLIALCIAEAGDLDPLATEAMVRAMWRVAAASFLACGLGSWLAFRGRIADQLKDR